MLSWKPRPIGKSPDDYARYVSYRLGITDPIAKHKELLKNGYLQEASFSETLNTYKIDELKKLINKYDIRVTGNKKAELINSIIASSVIKKIDLPPMYCLSEKGLSFIEKHGDLIQSFQQ